MVSRNRVRHRNKTGLKLDEQQVGAFISVGAAPSFDDVLLEAVDEVFTSLGKSVKTALYFHLKNTFGIDKSEIPSRIADFSDALEKIFRQGARLLEIQIMEKLNLKLGLACKWPTPKHPLNKWIVQDMTFQEYVRLMRHEFEATINGNGGSAE